MVKKTYKILLTTLSCLLIVGALSAQKIQISGTVTGASDGQSLIGVSILEAGTSNGTVTDIDGNYTITAGAQGKLIFSYIGFSAQEVDINNQTSINITLSDDATQLDEVVVVGYGREKKSTLTGAVASIDKEQLTTVPVANSANLLAGRVPGVMTRQNSGLPGSENTQIRIRGYAGSPLILVDGIQTSFDRVDPNDIETITVLKDAAAAVYGARAGNGVILVTTKRGQTGDADIAV